MSYHIKDEPEFVNDKYGWAIEIHHTEYPGWAVQLWDNHSPERCREKAQLICDVLNEDELKH